MKRKKIGRQPRYALSRWIKNLGCMILLVLLLFLFKHSIPGLDVRDTWREVSRYVVEPKVPKKYIPLYQEAAEAYGIPWTLLAAHHRVETKFSTMDPLTSPAGAEGHMQFMPCTFVGWNHPTCDGLGKGAIPKHEKTDPAIISKYGGYGVDGDKDGIANPYNLTDALYSAANYLSKSGAAEGNWEKAISTYNHSEEYVSDVLFYFEKYQQQEARNLEGVNESE